MPKTKKKKRPPTLPGGKSHAPYAPRSYRPHMVGGRLNPDMMVRLLKVSMYEYRSISYIIERALADYIVKSEKTMTPTQKRDLAKMYKARYGWGRD